MLADQAARAEVKCYQWDEDARMGGDQDKKIPLPRKHPLCRLMRRPNRHESGSYLRRRMVQQLSLTGTSLRWRVDNGMGTPQELWSVPTGTYQPVAPSWIYPDGAYRIMPFFPGPLAMVPGAWSAGGVIVPSDHMIAVRHPHPLVQHEGLAPLAACDLALDTIENIDRSRKSISARSIVTNAVIEADPTVVMPVGPDLTALRSEIQNLLGGPDKAGTPAMLSPGLTAKPWGAGNIEVGWIESWNQLIGFVLSVFGITKSLAFMSEDAAYAVLFAALKQFNLFTLCPLLDLIAEMDNIQLVEPFWGEDYFVELTPKVIDDDQLTEMKLANDLRAGARTVEEWRAIRDLPALDPKQFPWVNDRVGMPSQQQGQEGQPGQNGEAQAHSPLAPHLPGMNGTNGHNGTGALKLPGAPGGKMPPLPRDRQAEGSRPKNPLGAGALGNRIAPRAG